MKVDISIQDTKGITEIDLDSKALDEKTRKKIGLAEEIFDMIMRNIGNREAFLTPVCTAFRRVPVYENIFVETDGVNLFYNPDQILDKYRQRKLPELAGRILHMIMHGLLGHFSIRDNFSRKKVVDVAMDYEVEQLLVFLGEKDEERECFLTNEEQQVKNEYSKLGFREIYQREKKNKYGYAREKKDELKEDDHEIWNRDNVYHAMIDLPLSNQGGGGAGSADEMWKNLQKILFGSNGTAGSKGIKRLAKSMGSDKRGNGWGHGGGGGSDEVTAAKENDNSYQTILSEFFRESEGYNEMEGTIDKILYSYGFDLYGDVALIEPEEITEVKKLHTIVVAVDTSGSCCGSIMKYFIRETKNILRDVSCFAKFDSIIFIQCDADIQSEQWFYEADDIPNEDTFSMRGFGGTDFKPVFKRIEELRKDKELEIDCLLYLSDGYGDFPEEETDYPTFFILSEKCSNVPKWVRQIHLPDGIGEEDEYFI